MTAFNASPAAADPAALGQKLLAAIDQALMMRLQGGTASSKIAECRKLIEAGADLNLRDDIGRMALHKAIAGRLEDLIDPLLAHGADVMARSEAPGSKTSPDSGRAALWYAVWFGSDESFYAILARTPDIEQPNNFGGTPLLAAVLKDRLDFCEALIARGANVKQIDGNGSCALHLAIDCPDITDALLSAGANPDVVNHKGQTPLTSACHANAARTCETLIDAGASISLAGPGVTPPQDMYQDTPLRDIALLISARKSELERAAKEQALQKHIAQQVADAHKPVVVAPAPRLVFKRTRGITP